MVLSVRQAAVQLGIQEVTLRQLIAAGRVKAIERHVVRLGMEEAEVERVRIAKAETGRWPGAQPVGRPSRQNGPEWGDYGAYLDDSRISMKQAAEFLDYKLKQVKLLIENGQLVPIIHPESGKLALGLFAVAMFAHKANQQEGF